MNKKDGFGHEKPGEGETNDWITPKWLIDVFDAYSVEGQGKERFFDLDPCASITQPWSCAKNSYTVVDNGLSKKWFGRVWNNPPYGPHVRPWAKRMGEHADGIFLIFARLETEVWQDEIFPSATGFLFIKKRLVFYTPSGEPGRDKKGHISSAGAPSVLVSYGEYCADALRDLCTSGKIAGAFLPRATRSPKSIAGQMSLECI